jgi:rare lipoprotein A
MERTIVGLRLILTHENKMRNISRRCQDVSTFRSTLSTTNLRPFDCGDAMSQLAYAKCNFGLLLIAAALVTFSGVAHSEVASIYGGSDGLCGRHTANGERLDCSAMTAAHRTLPFGSRVRVCHDGCVVVRINDRGPWVRGRHIDLSPAAARAIRLHQTGHVTLSVGL